MSSLCPKPPAMQFSIYNAGKQHNYVCILQAVVQIKPYLFKKLFFDC